MSMQRERGVALLAAILVVALATVLVAAMLDRSETVQARTRNALRAEQGWQMMHGLEGWAAVALQRDREQDQVDSRNDIWARQMPPIELPGVRILGRMRDLNGCFNLNNLYIDGAASDVWMARFRRLLAALKLDEAIAEQALDWIDADGTPGGRGAEDMRLLLQQPPYRAANRPFAHVSELRLLPGVDAETYAILAPQVCALPPVASASPSRWSTINLNTATPELWMSVDERITPGIAQRMWREGNARFPDVESINEELLQVLGQGATPVNSAEFGVASQWFVLEAEIQADGIPFLYSALMQRTDTGTFVVAGWRGRY